MFRHSSKKGSHTVPSAPPPYSSVQQGVTPSKYGSAPPPTVAPSKYGSNPNSAFKKYNIPPESLQLLEEYDIIFIVDDSTSMNFNGGGRIIEVRETLVMFMELACEVDDDGVDLLFLNNPNGYNIKNPKDAQKIIDSITWAGRTPTGKRINDVLTNYKTALNSNPNTKPLSIVVITDGDASDKPLLEATIVDCAKHMKNLGKPKQVCFQFFQVGNDQNAKKFLEMLDDDLEKKYQIQDIVDCVHSQDGNLSLKERFIKALVGAIDPNIDRVSGYV